MSNKAQITFFVVGISAGFVLSIIVMSSGRFSNVGVLRYGAPVSHEEVDQLTSEFDPISFGDRHLHQDNTTIADNLQKKVKILVWVMTAPQNLQTKAIHVKNTWGRRADKLLFMSSKEDKDFPAVGIKTAEGREHLTAKTMQGFKYVYEHHVDDADWFMKADDDTYVVLENLRYFLSDKDSEQPVFYGHWFKTIVQQGYYSGGGGYVLSKEALRRFATRGFHSQYPSGAGTTCRDDGGAEDVEMGKCMENLGVKTGDSRDSLGRSRFHCLTPQMHIKGNYPDWYYRYDKHGAKMGVNSISDYAITFHYIPPDQMYQMEFFTYHLRPYGIFTEMQNINTPPSALESNATTAAP